MKTIPLLLILACGGDEGEPVRHVWECVEISDAPEPAVERFCADDEEAEIALAARANAGRSWACEATADECACEYARATGASGCAAE